MVNLKEILRAYDVSDVSEVYPGPVEITDLKEELGTKGHVLVVRGDKAYADKLGNNAHLANPKFWLYENLLKSARVQRELASHPDHKLFDGVGFSALEAIGYHAMRLGRKAVVVMAHEMVPEPEVFDRYEIEVIHSDPDTHVEEGYAKKQEEVISGRKDIILLHQALYGARALAPIGNKVARGLDELCIIPDETFWCIASGSNLYGIGSKIKERFNTKTVVVEPSVTPTIDERLKLDEPEQVKTFAKKELDNYCVRGDQVSSGIAPLHSSHVNRYMLLSWAHTGKTGIDSLVRASVSDVKEMQRRLADINPDYGWTSTTALSLIPAIQSAREGKNVLVIAYGKNRKTQLRDARIAES